MIGKHRPEIKEKGLRIDAETGLWRDKKGNLYLDDRIDAFWAYPKTGVGSDKERYEDYCRNNPLVSEEERRLHPERYYDEE